MFLKEPTICWANYTPEDYITKNEPLFESLDIKSDQEKYDNFINWKFGRTYKHARSYDYYQQLLYESLSYSYPIDKLRDKLDALPNSSNIYHDIAEDDESTYDEVLIAWFYDDSNEDEIRKLCQFYGYFISIKTHEGSRYKYVIESTYGVTDQTDDVYNNYNGICYHLTPKRNLEKIMKFGLYPKSKSKKVFHPERIYLLSLTKNRDEIMHSVNVLNLELYKGQEELVCLVIDLKKNPFKILLMKDPNYSEYGVFTHENISPACITEVIEVKNPEIP